MSSLMPWKRSDFQRSAIDSPAAPISTMRMDWDRMFDRILDGVWSPQGDSSVSLPLDVTETADTIRVRAEVPGMGPEDLDISLVGDVLTLSGQKVEEEESQEEARYYSERHFGSFQRAVKLSCPVDVETVTAKHKNGVVTITLDKAEAVRPKRISVKPA